ncbi:MAG: hypothetical protein J6R48_04835 [Muribaculaceae bacterium]|nr:hypothetical protein [Muribaculaceae bacterium]
MNALILFVFLVANALLFMNYYSASERIEKEDKEDIKQHITKDLQRMVSHFLVLGIDCLFLNCCMIINELF